MSKQPTTMAEAKSTMAVAKTQPEPAYETPQLMEYGTLIELTRSGPNQGSENDNLMTGPQTS